MTRRVGYYGELIAARGSVEQKPVRWLRDDAGLEESPFHAGSSYVRLSWCRSGSDSR